jgi:tRNA(Ile)-lysidine synthase
MVPDANTLSYIASIIHDTIARTLAERNRGYVLAVSGGADSMVLLHAVAAVLLRERIVVATYDHGTGPAATQAAALVAKQALRLGVPCITERATTPGRTEAEWRRARWAFLDRIARQYGASVVTAHTRDDQVETVFMRILREAGPRGLAALYAPSPVLRPFLDTPRQAVHEYAVLNEITFVADPSNADRRHLRNRIRHDLLPAITAAHPEFANELLTLAHRAAEWRARIDAIAATFSVMCDPTGAYLVPRQQLAGYSQSSLQTLWPALAARAGIVMDRRGTRRLALFTIEGESGQSIQLSGGVEVRMRRNALVLHRPPAPR